MSPQFPGIPILAAGLLVAAFPASAEDASRPEIPVIASVETEKLAGLEGQTVKVTGYVENTGKSGAGNQFLNFSGSEFNTVTFNSDVPKFGDTAPADTYRQKTVAVTGPIKIYKGKPEIVLNHPDQIEIIDPSEAAIPEEKPEAPPEPDAEPEPDPKSEPEPEAVVEKTPGENEAPADPAVPGPIDWRKYFPE